MSFVKIWVHLVFSTKNREPLLTKEVRIKLHQHIIENAKEKGIKLVNKELDNLGKNFKKTKDVSGLAGATLNEVGRTI